MITVHTGDFLAGKSAFESLINSSAERVLEKIKTRTIDLEPMDYFSRKMPTAPHTPPLVPSKARPRKLEPLRVSICNAFRLCRLVGDCLVS